MNFTIHDKQIFKVTFKTLMRLYVYRFTLIYLKQQRFWGMILLDQYSKT